jgi:hypothetical protein
MTNYEVPIVYRGQSNFIVEANSVEEAREKATDRFINDDTPDILGNEWEVIDRVGAITVVEEVK